MGFQYRNVIGTKDKYKFGIELEFSNINIGLLYKIFKKEKCNVKFSLNHKMCNFDFDKYWCLDKDPTVTCYEKCKYGNSYIGGELSSRVFVDEVSAWKEIKKVCNVLKNNNASVNGNCSNHIHVDINKVGNYNYFYEIFSKLIALYENDFILFYMGDQYLIRDTFLDYARPLKRDLLKKILDIDFNDNDYLNKLLHYNGCVFGVNDGVYINQFYNELEIRYPNGTLNEKTIQNNVSFSLKLIDAINNNKFDKSELNSLLVVAKKNMFNYYMFCRNNYEGFKKIVNTITNDSALENDFMTQYEKVLSTK